MTDAGSARPEARGGRLVIDQRAEAPHVVLGLEGEVDPATAPKLTKALDQVIDSGGDTDVELDCRGLTFLDSSGIAVLVDALQRLDLQGRRLFTTGTTGMVARVLDISGTAERLQPR